MDKPMKCKWCGKVDGSGEISVSVYQNLFKQFPKGQYVFLCVNCYRLLSDLRNDEELRYHMPNIPAWERSKTPMEIEPYEPLDGDEAEINLDEFQDRLNQEERF